MPGVLCGIGSRIWNGIARAIGNHARCGALRLERRSRSGLGAAPGQIAHAGRIGLAAVGDFGRQTLDLDQGQAQGVDVLAGQGFGFRLEPPNAFGQLTASKRLGLVGRVVGHHGKRRRHGVFPRRSILPAAPVGPPRQRSPIDSTTHEAGPWFRRPET